ncbi:MAG: flippase-like domain-containing protein [Candidatus Kapabacteria bacterium]|nr:flippase-like domain-containing protein [Candidatus Kapabacteria bacterium]
MPGSLCRLKMFWQRYGYWIKLAVSGALLVLLVVKVDTKLLMQSVRSLPWWYMPVAAWMYALAQTIATIRWWLISPGTRLGRLIYVTFSTQHLLFLIPSSLTTDVVRVVESQSSEHDSLSRIAGVVIDKVIGLSILTVLFGIAVWLDNDVMVPKTVQQPLAISAIVLGLIPMLVINLQPSKTVVSRIVLNLYRVFPSRTRARLGLVDDITQSLLTTLSYPIRTLSNTLLAVLGQVLSAATYLLFGLVFGFSITIEQCLFVSTAAQLFALLPVGIAGIGVRDASLVAMLASFGISPSVAFAASISGYPVTVAFAAGAWVMSMRRR